MYLNLHDIFLRRKSVDKTFTLEKFKGHYSLYL